MIRHCFGYEGRRNTRVCRFLDVSGPSSTNGMGSLSEASSFRRLIGEEEQLCWLVDIDRPSRFGVLTSSVLIVWAPRRLTECTSFNSCTVPFGLTFFGLEERDIVETDCDVAVELFKTNLLIDRYISNSFSGTEPTRPFWATYLYIDKLQWTHEPVLGKVSIYR